MIRSFVDSGKREVLKDELTRRTFSAGTHLHSETTEDWPGGGKPRGPKRREAHHCGRVSGHYACPGGVWLEDRRREDHHRRDHAREADRPHRV